MLKSYLCVTYLLTTLDPPPDDLLTLPADLETVLLLLLKLLDVLLLMPVVLLLTLELLVLLMPELLVLLMLEPLELLLKLPDLTELLSYSVLLTS